MKTKNFSVTGNGVWTWDGPWTVLYYEAGVDAAGVTPARIRVQSADGTTVDFEAKPGRQISLTSPANGVIVTSLTGNAIVGKVSIGSGDIKDSSLLGTVEVIDGELSRSKGGAAFIASAAAAPGGVGLYSQVQLWNPSTTKRLVVSELCFSSSLNAAFELRKHTASLQAGAAAGGISPKAVGSAATSVAQCWKNSTNNAHAGTLIETFDVAAYAPFVRKMTQPYVIDPGCGLSIENNIPNANAVGSFQFYEEAV